VPSATAMPSRSGSSGIPLESGLTGFVIITCDVIEPVKRGVGRNSPAEESSTGKGN
jgi:hypothetical protein